MGEDRTKDLRGKKKVQHYHSSFLYRYAVIQCEDQIKTHGTSRDKARTFSKYNGSLLVHGFTVYQQRMRDIWITLNLGMYVC